MAHITIVVGTVSGNAQICADCLRLRLPDFGHSVTAWNGDGAMPALAGRDVLLVCTSTRQGGGVPANLAPLIDRLRRERPDLSGLRFGVVALGDRGYGETFCRAGADIDALLTDLGASRIGQRLEIDASVQPLPEEEALDWAQGWACLV